MTTKLFIGRLSLDTTDSELLEAFKKFGDVTSASVVMDRATNQSRGFGFVEMTSDANAKKAIAELDGKDLQGSNIVVSVARPREEKSQNQAGFKRSW
ncbi:MAG: RNA-binding protein [Candidatus Saccharimonadales bacterium]